MRVLSDLSQVDAATWNALARHPRPGPEFASLQPFVRHEFLRALERSGCVGARTGWLPRHLLIESPDGRIAGALPLYAKSHSYGEYVFDWAWADAYERHGLDYYPKLLSAIPFTPVTGRRLLAGDDEARRLLAAGLMRFAADSGLSSLHLLFPDEIDEPALRDAGLSIRRGVQFHWRNRDYRDFDAFLDGLAQPKRKKIRAERRKVREAGVTIERLDGADLRESHWAFFHACYRSTYRQHRSTPYLNERFFLEIGASMPEHLMMAIASRDGRPIASSLLMRDDRRLYGRYWGALEHVPCLHFELAYYQTIEAAIERRIALIEGGAQGEHKMARGFEPVATVSAHWLRDARFAEAVDEFLRREDRMIGGYLDELAERMPFRARPALTG
ncbi:MAG: GNAT family N-acetyltransferase [Burkholderiaceae bacterium]